MFTLYLQKYKSLISKINYISFGALLASLPFPMPFIHFFWFIWIGSWLLEFRYLNIKNIKCNWATIYLSYGIIIWIAWNAISILWADNTQAAWISTLRYISLLTIPFAGIFGVNEHYNWYKCIKILLISSLISIGVYIFTHYWVINYPHAIDKHSLRAQIDIDWLHMDNLLLSIKHRMHYANLLCMLLPCSVIAYSKKQKSLLITNIIVILIALYLTGSRVALIYIVVLAVITGYWYILRKRKTWVKLIGLGVAIMIVAAGSFIGMRLHPRNEGLSMTELTRVDESNIKSPAFEPRFAIWHTALEHPKDYILYGLGAGNATDYLVKRYEELGWTRFVQRKYSPHNQFISVCMDLGIIATILFALFWICLPFNFRGLQRYWISCLTCICICSMMTDVLLGGLEGVVFVSIMLILSFIFPSIHTTEQTKQISSKLEKELPQSSNSSI